MAYEPTIWKDRVIERPKTFNIVNNPDGTATLVPVTGAVAEPGTPVNAANLNKLEQAVKTHEADMTQHGFAWKKIDEIILEQNTPQININRSENFTEFRVVANNIKGTTVATEIVVRINGVDAGYQSTRIDSGALKDANSQAQISLGLNSLTPNLNSAFVLEVFDYVNCKLLKFMCKKGIGGNAISVGAGHLNLTEEINTINIFSLNASFPFAASTIFEVWGR